MILLGGASDSAGEERTVVAVATGGSITGVPPEDRLSVEKSALISVSRQSLLCEPCATDHHYFIEPFMVADAAEGIGVVLGLNVGLVMSGPGFRSINLALPLMPASTCLGCSLNCPKTRMV